MHNPKRWLSINLQYDFCNIHKNWANIQPIQDDVHLTLSQQNFALSLLLK
jgi:hypothetical protein